MAWRWAVYAVIAVLGLPACDSGGSEASVVERDGRLLIDGFHPEGG